MSKTNYIPVRKLSLLLEKVPNNSSAVVLAIEGQLVKPTEIKQIITRADGNVVIDFGNPELFEENLEAAEIAEAEEPEVDVPTEIETDINETDEDNVTEE